MPGTDLVLKAIRNHNYVFRHNPITNKDIWATEGLAGKLQVSDSAISHGLLELAKDGLLCRQMTKIKTGTSAKSTTAFILPDEDGIDITMGACQYSNLKIYKTLCTMCIHYTSCDLGQQYFPGYEKNMRIDRVLDRFRHKPFIAESKNKG